MKMVIQDIFFEVDIDYPKELFNLHKDLPVLRESKKMNNVEKLICDIEDKKKCYSCKRFKTSTKSWIKIKKVHRIIQFKQKAWLKVYIDMNTELRKKMLIMSLRKISLNL